MQHVIRCVKSVNLPWENVEDIFLASPGKKARVQPCQQTTLNLGNIHNYEHLPIYLLAKMPLCSNILDFNFQRPATRWQRPLSCKGPQATGTTFHQVGGRPVCLSLQLKKMQILIGYGIHFYQMTRLRVGCISVNNRKKPLHFFYEIAYNKLNNRSRNTP